ncbi:LysR family transcriptional regulator [Micromonospora chalcea]|uniref:LysR family transcriptional regulator n=1 Tax=Micromonospora chalcea TaxID=1874 RepID=UPI0037B09CC2
MDLEIRHLRVVCAIADTGSISKAASRLGISQPSVTTLLQRVERMVGHQIFQRGRGGARSTTFGEQFLQRARLLVAEMDALRGNIAGPAGTIRFGSVHMECVSSLFQRLETSFPDISFSMCVEPSSLRLAQRLVHGDLDVAVLAIAESHQIPLPQELGERVLASAIPVYVAVSSAHRAAGLREIPLEGLKEEAWIRPPGGEDGSLSAFWQAARKAGFTPRIQFDVPSGGGRQLVGSGRAVQLVEPTSHGGPGVAVVPLAGEPLRMHLTLWWHRRRMSAEQADRLFEVILGTYSTFAMESPVFPAALVEAPISLSDGASRRRTALSSTSKHAPVRGGIDDRYPAEAAVRLSRSCASSYAAAGWGTSCLPIAARSV